MSRSAGAVRGIWTSVAWAEAGVVAAATLTTVAIVREIDLCFYFCSEEEAAKLGAGFWVLVGLALTATFGAFAAAARATGLRGWRALARGALASGVSWGIVVAATWLPNSLFWASLVVAVGLGGWIVVRPVSSRAWGVRLLAVVALVLLAFVGVWFAALAALPAFAVADTFALRREVATGG